VELDIPAQVDTSVSTDCVPTSILPVPVLATPVSDTAPPSSSLPHSGFHASNTVTVTANTTGPTGTAGITTTTTTTTQVTSTSTGATEPSNPQEHVVQRRRGEPRPNQVRWYPKEVQPFLISVRDQYRYSLFQLGFFPSMDEKTEYCADSWSTALQLWNAGSNLQTGAS
jgi:hypothetical protein